MATKTRLSTAAPSRNKPPADADNSIIRLWGLRILVLLKGDRFFITRYGFEDTDLARWLVLMPPVTDDKLPGKAVRKQLQIEHAPHISPQAKLVKLADKIGNVRDILASQPADWSPERKQAYFDWAADVVAGLRGVHPGLEAVFDGLYARRVTV